MVWRIINSLIHFFHSYMSNTFICNHCTDKLVEFSSLKDMNLHIKAVHLGQQVDKIPDPVNKEIPMIKAEEALPEVSQETQAPPPQLVYKYEGVCSICRKPVETIEVQLEEKNAVTAYCVPCHKTVIQRLVIPIEKQ